MIEREFPYALMLEDDRSSSRVRYNLRYHEHCSMLYSAMGQDVTAKICCGMVGELEKDGKADAAAQLLCAIMKDDDLHLIQPRLDVDICMRAIRAAFKHWPDSYELRSQLGLLAITLGRKEVAREVLKGMEGKWCPSTWRGKEDIVIALIKKVTPPEVAKPVVNSL
jgi:hypothetical protein